MPRKNIAALAACLLLGTALLAGCGEEEPVPTTTGGETTGVTQEQTSPTESRSTEPAQTESGQTGSAEPEATEPTAPEQTEPTEPAATEPEQTEPTEPAATEPEQTEPTEPAATEPEQTEPTEPAATEPEQTEPAQTTPTAPPQTTPLQDVCSVETVYGELHFQVQWSPYMQIRQEQEGDRVRVYFLARLNEKDYPLFDLTISADPGSEGQLQLTDFAGGKHGVEVNMEETLEHEELDAAGQELLYSMQEQVNFIIENLS